MTTQEQEQVNAAMAYMERQVGNLAREGANAAIVIAAQAQEIKALREELKKKSSEPTLEVVK